MSKRREAELEQANDHATRAEEFLAAAEGADGAGRVSAEEQAMVVRCASVHATLALYWQGEARDAREAL